MSSYASSSSFVGEMIEDDIGEDSGIPPSSPSTSFVGEMIEDNINEDSGWPYWESFNAMVLRCHAEITKETKYLMETHYPTKNFEVAVGISMARGLVPSVKLKAVNQSEHHISFDDFEWSDFLSAISCFSSLQPGEEREETAETENFCMATTILLEERIIMLKSRGVVLTLSLNDVNSFLNIQEIVNYRLRLLRALDVRTFYDNLLRYVLCGNASRDNCLDSIRQYCNLNVCDLSYCILEMMYINPEKVMQDYDRLCNFDTQ